MTRRLRDRARPWLGSAALHVAFVALLIVAAWNWRSDPSPQQLAIEGSVVRHEDLPASVRAGKPLRETPPVPPVEKPPEPAPITGNANDRKPRRTAAATAERTDWRIDHSLARQRRLMPATWIRALCGRRPAEVTMAPPKGISGRRASSRNGAVPARLRIAADLDRAGELELPAVRRASRDPQHVASHGCSLVASGSGH